MQTVREIARDILAREGGYVNDPNDPGGATKYGVTIYTMRRLGLDLNGDGRVTEADVKALTREKAEEIFVQHYFYKPGLDKLPESLQATVFDMYVNSGANAIRILQRVLTTDTHPLTDDGQLGPRTLRAARLADSISPNRIANTYGVARRDYYYSLGDKRPRSRQYARRRDGGKGGWITRAEEFISPIFHLTDRQHAERVAGWS